MSESIKTGKPATKAKNKYNAANYDSLRIVVPKGQKQAIEAHAADKGLTVNGLVNDLLRADMNLSPDEWRNSSTVIREKLRKQGYIMRKSRAAISYDNMGEYMVIDSKTNSVVIGSRYDATIEDIEEWFVTNGDETVADIE